MLEHPERHPQETPLGPAVRDRIMKRFGAWLDGVLADEPPPEGLDRELLDLVASEDGAGGETERTVPADLYAVVAGMTALTTEVKLQGRTFKDLCATLEPVADLDKNLGRVAAAAEESLETRVAERVRRAEHETRGSLVSVLLDVRDRLERGLGQARRRLESTPRTSGKRRLLGIFGRRDENGQENREALEAFEKGYALGLARIDQAVAELGITVLAIAPGGMFDPRTMNAVDVEETADVPEGTVREVFRTGYLWNDSVLRTAEVKVARAPAAREASHEA